MNHQPFITFQPSTIHQPPSTKRSAFTLVEVLAAMAVLVLLVLALTRMFVEASSISKRGTTMLMRNSTMETAMETLLQDAESMVVNDRLACYVVANTMDDPDEVPNGFGFDDVWFIGTSGDQDDDMPYEYFHFYVTNEVATSATGAEYVRFNLMKERMIMAVGTTRSGPTGSMPWIRPTPSGGNGPARSIKAAGRHSHYGTGRCWRRTWCGSTSIARAGRATNGWRAARRGNMSLIAHLVPKGLVVYVDCLRPHSIFICKSPVRRRPWKAAWR